MSISVTLFFILLEWKLFNQMHRKYKRVQRLFRNRLVNSATFARIMLTGLHCSSACWFNLEWWYLIRHKYFEGNQHYQKYTIIIVYSVVVQVFCNVCIRVWLNMILGRFEERWVSNLIPKKKPKRSNLEKILRPKLFTIENNLHIQILGIVGVANFRQKIQNFRLGTKPQFWEFSRTSPTPTPTMPKIFV